MSSADGSRAACVGRDHIWRQLRVDARQFDLRPILFLDRDGVVVEEVDYLHRVADIRFVPGVADTVVAARQAGWRIAVVTNQAGIGRGYYGWQEFEAVNRSILDWLDRQGAFVDMVLATPHHPDGVPPYTHASHPMRKPQPGMLVEAAEHLRGELAESIIVGDNASDQEAALRAGLRRGYHVLTGHGQRYRAGAEALRSSRYGVQVIADAGDIDLRTALFDSRHQTKEEVR